MGDWLLNLPIPWMAVVIFSAVYLLAVAIYLTVIRLAVDGRARAFKALSPGMLPPLGIIFGLLVGFVAVEIWVILIGPRTQLPMKQAHFVPLCSSPNTFPMSRSLAFVLSLTATSRKQCRRSGLPWQNSALHLGRCPKDWCSASMLRWTSNPPMRVRLPCSAK